MDDEQPCKCPAGIPAWVLTFADLMSLLMCFFVLLLSFAEMDVQKFKQIAGSMKTAFGVQRDIKAVEIPKGVNIVAKEFSPSPPQPTVINEVRQVTSDDTQQELKLIDKLDRLQNEENELKDKMDSMSEAQAESEGLKKRLSEVQAEKAEVEQQLRELREKMNQVQAKQIKEKADMLSNALMSEIEAQMIDVEANDTSITIRIRDKGSFASGTADLTEDFIEILEIIAQELGKTSGDIIVAGHTDDIPINTPRFQSNWELSAARSAAVVHELLRDKRIERLRFSLQAFADAKPLVANDSVENRAKNRRVEIIISQSKEDLGIAPNNSASSKPVEPKKIDTSSVIKNRPSAAVQQQTPSNNRNTASKKPGNVSDAGSQDIKSTESKSSSANNDTTEDTPSFIQF